MTDNDITQTDVSSLSPQDIERLLKKTSEKQFAMFVDTLDFDSLRPEAFVRIVKAASKSQLEQLMKSGTRGKALDEVFRQMERHFAPEQATPKEKIIHWRLGGRPDGGHDEYETVIADGRCTVNPRFEREPRVTVTVGAVDFIKLVVGQGNPTMMYLRGKIKTQGDRGLAANFSKLFHFPDA
jgi:putative sterol carrier protein